MLEIIVSVIAGMVLALLCVAFGGGLVMYAFRKGATLTDNVYHDKAPFDKDLNNEEPLDSHVDGGNLDEDT